MARHRITGEFVATMSLMDGSLEESAEILMGLMYERFGYMHGFEIHITDDCEVEATDEDEAEDAKWAQADADYDQLQEDAS
jgi:hypothetical protein